MMINNTHFRLRELTLALCAALPLLAQAGVAGHFQFVAGDVRVVGLDGKERLAQKGQEIHEGETLRSSPNASAQIKMVDGGFIALRPESQIKLDAYSTQGIDSGKEKALVSLAKGGFRTVTGLIGKTNKSNYSIITTTATIGIRGTDHEPMVIAPPPPGTPATNPPGTYDKVNVGATSLTTQAGTALIERNQVGFAAAANQAPVVLPKAPDFYQAATPPASKQEQKKEGAAQSQNASKADDKPAATASSSSPQAEANSNSASADAATSTVATGDISTTTEAPIRISTPTDVPPVITSTNAPITTVTPVAPLPLTGTDASGNTISTTTIVNTVPTKNYVPGQALLMAYPSNLSSTPAASWLSISGQHLALTRDAAGQLTGATRNTGDGLFRTSYTATGGSLLDVGQHSASGLSWGRWQGGQLTQSGSYWGQDASGQWGYGALDANSTFVIGASYQNVNNLGSASAHWILGQEAYPRHLAQVLTGTATYTYVGGTRPTDTLGNVGILYSANLAANFTTQTVSAGVDFTIGGNHWVLQSTDMPIERGGADFKATSSTTTCTGCGSVGTMSTFNKNGMPAPSTSYAYLSGQLLGTGLNSAALQYSVSDDTTTPYFIQGVAGFSGPTQDVTTPYRAVGIDGWDSYGYMMTAVGPMFPEFIGQTLTGTISSTEAPANRVITDSTGALTEFMGSASYLLTNTTTLAYADAATIKIGSALNKDVGSTIIDGIPVSWGRWEGGAVDIWSMDGSTKLGSISNLNKSIHWIASGVLTGPVSGSLPLTGTASYTLVGNTSPTDMQGNVGTLGSVTLNADFGAMRANASVAATVNNNNWNLTASNLPINTGGEFKGGSTLSGATGGTVTATCSGAACGTQTYGALNGTFVGTAAAGAVMSYRMVTGGATATTSFTPTNAITGLAVLKK